MAKLTSHTLNGFDGTHAASIAVHLFDLTSKKTLVRAIMDDGGRL